MLLTHPVDKVRRRCHESGKKGAPGVAPAKHGTPPGHRAPAGGGAMTTPPPPATSLPASRRNAAFATWFRGNYGNLMADLMRVGANFDEAQEHAAEAATDLFKAWETVEHPRAWARQAAIHYLIKSRERGQQRLKERLIQTGQVTSAREDRRLTAWEDQEWVMDLLTSLPPAQKEVIACVVDHFSPAEIAKLLGKTPATIRRALADARQRLKHDLAAAAKAEAEAMAKAGSRRSIPAAMVGSKEDQ